jgi:hypothetical protein
LGEKSKRAFGGPFSTFFASGRTVPALLRAFAEVGLFRPRKIAKTKSAFGGPFSTFFASGRTVPALFGAFAEV